MMAATFKKILNEDEAAAIDAKKAKERARFERLKAKKIANPAGPYQRKLNDHMEKTGKTHGVTLPQSEKSIAPPRSRTYYKDSAVKGQFKQWSIWTEGRDVITEWGRTGSTLMTNRKTHASPAAASVAMEKISRTKRLEGYRNNP